MKNMLFGCLLIALAGPSWGRDLGDVLRMVETHASALQSARARVVAEEEAVRAARAQLYGEVDVFARDIHYNDERLVRPIFFPPNVLAMPFDDDQIAYGLKGRLPLDVSGRLRAGIKAAQKGRRAAAADAEDLRLRLLNRAAKLYRGLQRVSGEREALEKQKEALEAHIRVAEAAIRVGRLAPVERLRLVAELKGVEGKLADLRGTEAGLRARLAALMEVPSFTDPTPLPPSPPKLLETRVIRRPDIQAAEARAQAAAALKRRARAERLPSLDVSGNLQRSQGYNGEGDDTWQVTLEASLPLWDGQRRSARVREAQARLRAAHLQRRSLEVQAQAEVEAALGDWKAAEARHAAAQSAVAAARETAAIQADRFAAGRLSAADLVDAEAALARARAEEAASLAAWWQADDDLRLALGLPPADYKEGP